MSSTSNRARIEEELKQIRSKGIAQNQKEKLKNAGTLRTPEEEAALKKKILAKYRHVFVRMPKPSETSSSEACDLWYRMQKQLVLIEKKKREEALQNNTNFKGSFRAFENKTSKKVKQQTYNCNIRKSDPPTMNDEISTDSDNVELNELYDALKELKGEDMDSLDKEGMLSLIESSGIENVEDEMEESIDEPAKSATEVEDSDCKVADTLNMNENLVDEEKFNKSAVESIEMDVSVENEENQQGDNVAEEKVNETVSGENVEKENEPDKTEENIDYSVSDEDVETDQAGNIDLSVEHGELVGAAQVRNKKIDEEKEDNQEADEKLIDNLAIELEDLEIEEGNEEICEGTEKKENLNEKIDEEKEEDNQEVDEKVIDNLTVEFEDLEIEEGNEEICEGTEEKENLNDENIPEEYSLVNTEGVSNENVTESGEKEVEGEVVEMKPEVFFSVRGSLLNKPHLPFSFRNIISREDDRFSPEKGRYHLFASPSCPWSHQVLIVISLKGLQDTIPVTIAKPILEKQTGEVYLNWVFETSLDEESKPFLPDFRTSEDLYMKTNDEFRSDVKANSDVSSSDVFGQYTLPVLYDSKLNVIVNNCPFDMIRMLATEFDDYSINSDLDLYPSSIRDEIDNIHNWTYSSFSNAIHKCSGAINQEEYLELAKEVTSSFDQIESLLKDSKFLVGETMTIADICLFVTLYRFDEVYAIRFLINSRLVMKSPDLLRFCQCMYLPEVAKTCNMDQIKTFYYCNEIVPKRNHSIVPIGPGFVSYLQ